MEGFYYFINLTMISEMKLFKSITNTNIKHELYIGAVTCSIITLPLTITSHHFHQHFSHPEHFMNISSLLSLLMWI